MGVENVRQPCLPSLHVRACRHVRGPCCLILLQRCLSRPPSRRRSAIALMLRHVFTSCSICCVVPPHISHSHTPTHPSVCLHVTSPLAACMRRCPTIEQNHDTDT